MPEPPPPRRADLVSLRRSLAATGQLPAGEVRALIDELERLLAERHDVADLVRALSSPWADVRTLLNQLHQRVTEQS